MECKCCKCCKNCKSYKNASIKGHIACFEKYYNSSTKLNESYLLAIKHNQYEFLKHVYKKWNN